MRPLRFFTAVFLLAIGFMFALICFLNSYGEEIPVKGLMRTNEGGVIYNIESNDESNYFVVNGFEYFEKPPVGIRAKGRNFSKLKRIWSLHTKGAKGSISISKLQPRGLAEQPVIVSITYFITWASGMSVTGVGTNRETKELETAVEMLSAAEGEGSVPGFCRKLVYLGPVDEVRIDGFVSPKEDSHIAIIDGIQVSVGKTKLENEEDDMVCT